ncbi:MAG: hypothetical protein ABL931_18680 [Usitatibacteraceae bacterium]
MKVNLPTPLVEYTDGARDVEASGATLDGLLRDLDRQYPGIRFRMIDEQAQIRAHIKLFLRRLGNARAGGAMVHCVISLTQIRD